MRPIMVKVPTMGPSAGTQGIRKIHPGPEIAMNPRNLPTADATTPPSIRTDGKTAALYHPQVHLDFTNCKQATANARLTIVSDCLLAFWTTDCLGSLQLARLWLLGNEVCMLLREEISWYNFESFKNRRSLGTCWWSFGFSLGLNTGR